MTVNRTTLLNLPLPVTGTESGTWGDTTNNGLTQYIDIAVAGMTSLTSSDFTAGALSLSNSTGDSSATNIAASSAQYGAIKVSSLATNSTITAPSSNRRYVIINADATYNLIIKASGQTGVTVVPGEKALVAFNGTDYVKVGGAAGGSTTQIQFNNAGVFGGSANLTWDGTNVQIGAAGALRLADTDSSNYVAFKSPGTVASNVTWTLPSADGTNGQALTTNGSGTLAFSTISTSAATPTTLGTVYGSMTTSGASPYLTALGYDAGASTTGVNNTFIGFEAGNDNTTGTDNTAVGYQALDVNTIGIRNTAIGSGSLGANTTGSYNTAVGQVSLNKNTTGANNVALGYAVLSENLTGGGNTGIGWQALGNSTASNNTAVGYGALQYDTTGADNTAVGYGALDANTTGYDNSAVGRDALGANTTGFRNIAMGRYALSANTTGSDNVSLGNSSLGNSTTASYNTAIGYAALNVNTTGDHNTAVGYGAGSAITTGSKNSILGTYNGNQGGLDIRTASNNIVLSDGDGNPNFISGYLPTAASTYQAATRVVTMGLGGSSATRDGNLFLNGSTASGWGPVIAGRADGAAAWYVGSYSVIVSGTNQYLTCANTSGGVYLNGASATSWTAVSDETRKVIIEPITDAANKVATLRTVIGRLKTDEEDVRRPYLIAQDVQAVLPEAVSETEDRDGPVLGLSYTEVIPLLTAAIKEMKSELDSVKAELATLKGA